MTSYIVGFAVIESTARLVFGRRRAASHRGCRASGTGSRRSQFFATRSSSCCGRSLRELPARSDPSPVLGDMLWRAGRLAEAIHSRPSPSAEFWLTFGPVSRLCRIISSVRLREQPATGTLHDVHCSLIQLVGRRRREKTLPRGDVQRLSALSRGDYWGGIPHSLFRGRRVLVFLGFAVYLFFAGDSASKRRSHSSAAAA